ncbi:hypothetical protein DSL92_06160 [Billgrantia gudaonensis]|uniref:Uncharacterized protein n=1 Tax=Billgrantia gudaonensis TaxID=376427 RepID=A0A432JIR0_9GAMM|nr:hypothetical protein DSL92_06160 [Halomonas gudaonensis]
MIHLLKSQVTTVGNGLPPVLPTSCSGSRSGAGRPDGIYDMGTAGLTFCRISLSWAIPDRRGRYARKDEELGLRKHHEQGLQQ